MKNLTILEKPNPIIRQELNLEKWPIFTSSTSRKKSREIIRSSTLENGDKILRKVTIGKTSSGELDVFRIFDYKVFSVLIYLWEKAGRPINTKVSFALHEIAQTLGLSWGGKTLRAISNSLHRLKEIPIIWENSFFNKATGLTDTMTFSFSLLDNCDIFERSGDTRIYFSFSSFKLNEKITTSLLNNNSKPVYLNVVIGLKKDISVLLYRHIDLVMSDKNIYERRTEELFKDLDLGEYKYPSDRRRLLDPVLKELQGVELTTGFIKMAKMEKTKDEKDWKIVFVKEAKKPTQQLREPQVLDVENIKTNNESTPEQQQEIEESNSEVGLVVQSFNQRFPQYTGTLSEELAANLIGNYSLEKVMLHVARTPSHSSTNNPAGFLKKSLEENWSLPPTGEEIQVKEKQAKNKLEQEKKDAEQKQQEKYFLEKGEEERLDKIFFGLPLEEQERLKEEARQRILTEHLEDGQEKMSKLFLRDFNVRLKVQEILKENQ